MENHPKHALAFPLLRAAKNNEFEFILAAHSLLEVYAVLTRIPIYPKISPAIAFQLIHENISGAKIVALTGDEYISIIENAINNGIAGGSIYDALIAYAAKKAKVDILYTFNKKDFLRVMPDLKHKIAEP